MVETAHFYDIEIVLHKARLTDSGDVLSVLSFYNDTRRGFIGLLATYEISAQRGFYSFEASTTNAMPIQLNHTRGTFTVRKSDWLYTFDVVLSWHAIEVTATRKNLMTPRVEGKRFVFTYPIRVDAQELPYQAPEQDDQASSE